MKNSSKKCAIVLCSGGLDSVTTAYYVKKKLKYEKIIILFFDYQQRSLVNERLASKKCARNLGGEFKEMKLGGLAEISGSLINKNSYIKEIKKSDLRNTKRESEKYYVPCRNLIFLSYAIALAESIYTKKKIENDIFVGFKCEGKESYPDTTINFVNQINKVSQISCRGKFKIIAPLIKKDKEDIILLGKKLNVKFKETFSCYMSNNVGKHCGKCLACALRKAGFYWANEEDPTDYSRRD
jgi:7-cyano-7-deazaguanine synthase